MVVLQMSSKSGSRKQPAPMPKGYAMLRLPHILGHPARDAAEGTAAAVPLPASDPCAAAAAPAYACRTTVIVVRSGE